MRGLKILPVKALDGKIGEFFLLVKISGSTARQVTYNTFTDVMMSNLQ